MNKLRKIEFRGRKIDSTEWVYGNLVSLFDDKGSAGTGIAVGSELHLVDSKTIGQYTGIKDKSGMKKIYEGDILEYGYIVTYVDGSDTTNLGMDVGFYEQRDDFESYGKLIVGEEYAVIGNIYK